jgi:hypothetical protein
VADGHEAVVQQALFELARKFSVLRDAPDWLSKAQGLFWLTEPS